MLPARLRFVAYVGNTTSPAAQFHAGRSDVRVVGCVGLALRGRIYFKTRAMPETIRATFTSLWNCISLSFRNTCRPSHAPAMPGSA